MITSMVCLGPLMVLGPQDNVRLLFEVVVYLHELK